MEQVNTIAGFIEWQLSIENREGQAMVSDILDNDVLLGRGTSFAKRPANLRYRRILKRYRVHYLATVTAKEKREILDKMVIEIGGRLLRRNTANTCWIETTGEEARLKVAQALQYQLRHYKSSRGNGGYSSDGNKTSMEKSRAALAIRKSRSLSIPTGTSLSSVPEPDGEPREEISRPKEVDRRLIKSYGPDRRPRKSKSDKNVPAVDTTIVAAPPAWPVGIPLSSGGMLLRPSPHAVSSPPTLGFALHEPTRWTLASHPCNPQQSYQPSMENGVIRADTTVLPHAVALVQAATPLGLVQGGATGTRLPQPAVVSDHAVAAVAPFGLVHGGSMDIAVSQPAAVQAAAASFGLVQGGSMDTRRRLQPVVHDAASFAQGGTTDSRLPPHTVQVVSLGQAGSTDPRLPQPAVVSDHAVASAAAPIHGASTETRQSPPAVAHVPAMAAPCGLLTSPSRLSSSAHSSRGSYPVERSPRSWPVEHSRWVVTTSPCNAKQPIKSPPPPPLAPGSIDSNVYVDGNQRDTRHHTASRSSPGGDVALSAMLDRLYVGVPEDDTHIDCMMSTVGLDSAYSFASLVDSESHDAEQPLGEDFFDATDMAHGLDGNDADDENDEMESFTSSSSSSSDSSPESDWLID